MLAAAELAAVHDAVGPIISSFFDIAPAVVKQRIILELMRRGRLAW